MRSPVPTGWGRLEPRVRAMVSPTRWRHIQGVVETARELARRFGLDEGRAAVAALLHDAARDWPLSRLTATLAEAGERLSPLEQASPELLHGPAAAHWARAHLGVDDGPVLDAVRYHTTGRPGMSPLEMVLVVADYSEPGREFAEAAAIREAARQSLEGACLLSLDARLRYLLDRGHPIHPRTVEARNWLLMRRASGCRA
ncbi:bis(5'-nucleosyl)-tetraphosphatase (symmetrical) YqeK [Geochorda subterranea]|uniref:bis(5'-nucleosyl)-tetraphosphatase (symmetrical) n=1 Tax=Geochorda subterranea TaxID=3109564 RepID=A0ABZ1BLY7_9FIRM|nr:bis(5'-nucleosyl)-tetraphosphatase (symmetrical) YqeK [Limnochorda sp. LNt]WRP13566.1 bis(5'-nucleosyl)-tetraphosphatase (symmetrical) YqeK [Limnochorda sp. LNt]